jgi:transmembrane sensor
MNKERLTYLYQQYLGKKLSPEEFIEFKTAVSASENNGLLQDLLDQHWEGLQDEGLMEVTVAIDKRIQMIINERQAAPRRWMRYAVAATLTGAILTAGYFFLSKPKTIQQFTQMPGDIAPFSRQAVLKTGHGKTIILNDDPQGTLAQYGNTHIRKNSGDQIAYTNDNTAQEITTIFDTLQVPAGGRPYHLKLPDGSSVAVNVASAIRFPENFRKGPDNSKLELIAGEAYFVIAHDQHSPLTIKAKGQMIEDIGTEFNVNTYDDAPDSRTTLITGNVHVNRQKLEPGQQAIIKGAVLTIAIANISQTVAWKDGYFRFNGENIQTIMRELTRWYNIEIIYEGKTKDVGYYLKISRSKNISEVLEVLERTNSVHFKIEGRRITVLSKK